MEKGGGGKFFFSMTPKLQQLLNHIKRFTGFQINFDIKIENLKLFSVAYNVFLSSQTQARRNALSSLEGLILSLPSTS